MQFLLNGEHNALLLEDKSVSVFRKITDSQETTRKQYVGKM
jgi:hypothetical protein